MALTSGGEKIKYDKLILATGSLPVVPRNAETSDYNNVYYVFKDLEYLASVKNCLKNKKNIVIVGGGFIGVEVAEEISKLVPDGGITIVEAGPKCLWQSFDPEFSEMVEKILCEKGINIRTSETVEKLLEDNGSVTHIELSGGDRLGADAVIFAVGVRPDTALAAAMGLELDRFGAIKVDNYMRADKDIYAIGDCAGKQDFFTGEPASVMLASVAATEAKIAAQNIYHLTGIVRRGNLSVVSTTFDEISLGSAGLTERDARTMGFNIMTGTAEFHDRHPACLLGVVKQVVKLVFDRKSGVILGGQAYGGRTVGELINVIGLAVQNRMTASQIIALQMATHPMVTPGPTMYTITTAAENALTC